MWKLQFARFIKKLIIQMALNLQEKNLNNIVIALVVISNCKNLYNVIILLLMIFAMISKEAKIYRTPKRKLILNS